MQEEIDKKNRERVKEELKKRRIAKREATREQIKGVLMRPVKRVEKYFEDKAVAREESRKLQEKEKQYQDSCQEEYLRYLQRSKDHPSNGEVIHLENGATEHIVDGDVSPIIYTQRPLSQGYMPVHEDRQFEGFTTIKIDGIEQQVYVKIHFSHTETPENYGPHGDWGGQSKYSYNGFMRTPEGRFLKIDYYSSARIGGRIYDYAAKDSVKTEVIQEVYDSISSQYDRCSQNTEELGIND